MSQKSKQKDKKSDVHVELERKCEELISELLEKDNMLKQAQERTSRLGVDLFESKTEAQRLKSYIKDEFQKLHLTNQNLKNRVSELTSNKNELQIQVATLRAKLQFEKKEHEDWKKDKERQFDDLKRHFAAELGRYELQSTEYSISINEKHAMASERVQLLKMIDEERQEFKRKLADRDRDKIQALDSLKKEMKDKFKDMKNSLLSIRREQLDNNTRLTMLQNHQLIQELEYQSINTEKVVDRNVDMEKKIRQLETELEIREEVQKEVVKRSAISKNILKTFQEKAQTLEKENQQLQKEKQIEQQKIKCEDNTNKKMNELMKTLQTAHFRIQKLEKDLSLKDSQLNQSFKKIHEMNGKGQKIIEALCSYFTSTLSNNQNQVQSLQELDLTKLKNKDVKDWKPWEVKLFVEALLNQVKMHMATKHFDVQTWRKVVDSRIAKMIPEDKENVVEDELKIEKKCDSEYIRSLSLEKNKLFYQNRRKLSAKNRSLTKTSSNHTISFGRYVQSNIREWGPEVKANVNKSLADRFMKPIKGTVK